MSLVLDASVTLAWIYQDETTEGVQRSFDLVGPMAHGFRFYGFGGCKRIANERKVVRHNTNSATAHWLISRCFPSERMPRRAARPGVEV